MNHAKSFAILGAALALAVSVPADAMRCGGKIVSTGDHKTKVEAICGEPASTESRRVVRSGIPRVPIDEDSRTETASERELAFHQRSFVEVVLEVWLFNRGPRRLMREVVFENGRVLEINTAGYGY